MTIEHLVTDDNRKAVKGDQYKICMNEDCDVVYFNTSNGVRFIKDQIIQEAIDKGLNHIQIR